MRLGCQNGRRDSRAGRSPLSGPSSRLPRYGGCRPAIGPGVRRSQSDAVRRGSARCIGDSVTRSSRRDMKAAPGIRGRPLSVAHSDRRRKEVTTGVRPDASEKSKKGSRAAGAVRWRPGGRPGRGTRPPSGRAGRGQRWRGRLPGNTQVAGVGAEQSGKKVRAAGARSRPTAAHDETPDPCPSHGTDRRYTPVSHGGADEFPGYCGSGTRFRSAAVGRPGGNSRPSSSRPTAAATSFARGCGYARTNRNSW
jgi:hypothetical protein